MSKKSYFLLVLLLVAIPLVAYGKQGNGKLPDPNQPGPFSVGHVSFVLTDDSRSTVDHFIGDIPRPIPVDLFYPANLGSSPISAIYPLDQIHFAFDPFLTYSGEWEAQGIDPAYQGPPVSGDGPFPLVLFSPGWGMSALSSLYIGTRLASYGFVVALIYHYGDGVMSNYYEPFDNLAVAAMNRPLDISFTLTKLLERNATVGDLIYHLIDPDKVAASGWSLGGYAAMALVAGDDSVCDKPLEMGVTDVPYSTCVPTPVDSRIRAIVPLDGTTWLLYFDELARINVPTMGIGQEWSTLEAIGVNPSSQARLHAAGQGHPAYRIDVQGAFHQSFSNMCESLPIQYSRGLIDPDTYPALEEAFCGAPLPTNEVHRIVTKYMVAFLKTNLDGEPGYQPILTPGHALKDESMVEFFVTEKRNPHVIDEDWPETYVYFTHQPGSEQAKAEKNPKQALPVFYGGLGGEKQ